MFGDTPCSTPIFRRPCAALATAPVIDYLKRLGVTTLELMPVHAFVDDRRLVERGLRNYWGYNTIGFFAPDTRYSSSGKLGEFKTMVKTLHSAGFEVILDVVYNHTAEGNHLGPTLCFRGIDNVSYYRLQHDDRRFYTDYTGTGNTLDMQHPRVLQLLMDSLRYWVTDMHVDGFRFDLASSLARELHEVNRLGAFFDILRQDPVLSRVKLIAEFSRRLTGSSDLYGRPGRLPHASINFITAHDGFTLQDLVSYNEKHNEANLEENRDGNNNNLSWNCGVEGPTDDPAVNALRARQKRNMLATLLLSQGVPMLIAGDEIGRTQQGNNNAYCQDSVLSWLDWELDPERLKLRDFVCRMVHLRRTHPVFRRRHFFQGRPLHGSEAKDIVWLKPDGSEMTTDEWSQDFARCLGVYLVGSALTEIDARGQRVVDDDFVVLFNAHHDSVPFRLPTKTLAPPGDGRWQAIVDTARDDGLAPDGIFDAESTYPLEGRWLVLSDRRRRACRHTLYVSHRRRHHRAGSSLAIQS